MAKKNNWLDKLAWVLLTVSGIAWGLYVFGFNLVTTLLGEGTFLTHTLFIAIGIAGLYSAYWLSKNYEDMSGWQNASFVLLIVGAVAWGVMGAFGVNIVNMLLGFMSWLPTVVYVLVGVSGVYSATMVKKIFA